MYALPGSGVLRRSQTDRSLRLPAPLRRRPTSRAQPGLHLTPLPDDVACLQFFPRLCCVTGPHAGCLCLRAAAGQGPHRAITHHPYRTHRWSRPRLHPSTRPFLHHRGLPRPVGLPLLALVHSLPAGHRRSGGRSRGPHRHRLHHTRDPQVVGGCHRRRILPLRSRDRPGRRLRHWHLLPRR